ncbi:MAG: ABC transporter permease subunit [Candidatus Aureabacteria bacterium]|nr:ABC transporter permease subunit [Candidatus Auribacterota bacterium]
MRKIGFSVIYFVLVSVIFILNYTFEHTAMVSYSFWNITRAVLLIFAVIVFPLLNRRIYSIAVTVLKEELRKKTLYVIFIFVALLVSLIHVFGKIAPANQHVFVGEMGLSGITLFGLLFGVFMSSTAMYKEMEKKTVYVLLSYPVSRQEIVMGKFIGNMISILLFSFLLSLIFVVSLLVRFGPINSVIVYSCFALMLEFVVIVAIATTTSTMLSSTSNIVFVIIIFLLGHMTEKITHIASRLEAQRLKEAAEVFVRVLPDFKRFEFKDALSLGTVIEPSVIIASLSYALFYSAVALIIGMLIFRRREVDRL